MTPALSLRSGDRVPDFVLPGLDGKLRKLIWSFTGEPVALLVIDDLAASMASSLRPSLTCCKDAATTSVVVCGNAVAAAAPLWAKLGGKDDGPLLLCDGDRKFVPALLAQGGVSLGSGGGLRLRVIVLDPNQRVAATFDTRPLLAAAESIGSVADGVRSNAGASQVIGTAMAPVLVLPRVFEPDFCTQVIRLWQKGDHQDSGVSSRYGNVGVLELKRTEDYMVVEPMMQKAISDRLAWRIGPELIKVFAFDREFSFDAHVVLSYSAEAALLRRPSRQRRADHRRPRLRRLAQPQRRLRGRRAGLSRICRREGEPACRRCRRLLLLGAAQALPVTRGRRFVLTTFFRAKK